MSRYKEQLLHKKNYWARPPTPFGRWPKKNPLEVFPYLMEMRCICGINITLLFPDDVSSARRPVIVSPPSQYNSLTLVVIVIKYKYKYKKIQKQI